jgi:hypothetical protein
MLLRSRTMKGVLERSIVEPRTARLVENGEMIGHAP